MMATITPMTSLMLVLEDVDEEVTAMRDQTHVDVVARKVVPRKVEVRTEATLLSALMIKK